MDKTLEQLIDEYGTSDLLEMMFSYIQPRKDIIERAKNMVNTGKIQSINEVVIPRFKADSLL